MSTTEWVIEDALFRKIKDLMIPENVLKHFITEVIYKHEHSRYLLPKLSDIIVLVAFPESETFIRESEKSITRMDKTRT